MDSVIQIVEKPEWVSWEEIKQCLMSAHAENRAKGINMGHAQWSAEQIRDFVGDKGVMFVALDGKKVVGTASIIPRPGYTWFTPEHYAFLGFDGVCPEYRGRGIYKELMRMREGRAREMGLSVLVLDTHKDNLNLQQIALKDGFRYVRYFLVSNRDHFNVAMAKWLDGCPYSRIYCRWRFLRSRIKAPIQKLFFGLVRG